MDIFEIMDCEDCDCLKVYRSRTWGDPDSCHDGESVCSVDAPDSGPCERMQGAIFDWIHDGEFAEKSGQMYTGELLCDTEGDGRDVLSMYNIPEGRYDFATAEYWWLSCAEGTEPIPYKDERAVYRKFFI